jgi:hypothetical protein
MASAAGTLTPTTFAACLLAIQARAMAVLGFPQERVILWARDEESWHPQGDQIVRIRPRQQLPTPTVVGGGRPAGKVTRTVNVCLWSRYNVDSWDNDQAWLTDPTNGFLAFELAVMNALFHYHAPDPNGSGMLFEPLKPVVAAQPSKNRAEADWGTSECDFDVTYVIQFANATYL